MKHYVKFSIYIPVEADDEDTAYELAEQTLNECAALPLDAPDALINLLEYEDTVQDSA